jgi:peptide/nickel transport system substrate-binding protein
MILWRLSERRGFLMPNSRFISLIIICFSLLVLLPACGKDEPATGDCFREASIAEPLTLMPPLVKDAPSRRIVRLIYSGLVKYDGDLRLVPDLAECWDISPDQCAITFYLRKEVKWHDGKKDFTAYDVKFTLEKIKDPKTSSPYKSLFEEAESEVLDQHIIRITYPKPFAPALDSWTMAILPRHKLEGQDLSQSPMRKEPIGTGPYMFDKKKSIPGKKIVLTANPDYFSGRVFLDSYEYLVKPEATLFSDLKAEKIDRLVLTPPQYLYKTGYHRFARRYKKYHYLPFAFEFLAYNQKNPLFEDKVVRQALTQAIDKQKIIDRLFLGLGQVAYGPYKPGAWYYNDTLTKERRFDYSPSESRKKLEEAGWKPNAQGMLEKNNQPFEFTIITNSGNMIRLRTAEIIKRQLRKVGIEVRIQPLHWNELNKEVFENQNFDALLLAWDTGIDPDQYDFWHSSKTKPGEFNFIHYKNSKVDNALEKGRHTLNQEERKLAYFRLQELLAEDQPYTFLFIPYELTAIHQRFRGVKLAPAGLDYNFEQWYVPKGEQKCTGEAPNTKYPSDE